MKIFVDMHKLKIIHRLVCAEIWHAAKNLESDDTRTIRSVTHE